MKHYELIYIIPIKAGSEEDTTVADKVRAMLKEEGATISQEDSLGKKKLAYPIKGLRHGNYILVEFDLESTKLARVNNWFRMSTEVLRSQIILKPLKSPEQLAREKAFQEKLMKIQAREEAETKEPAKPADSEKPAPAVESVPRPVQFDDLDKKIEEILEQEIVK
ncbi:30S ribosomal protein S6 [Patescibacteria group bacterium]|nr:30S ribosomal protein S6 [Patescibacteria group bacterium]